MVDVERSTNTPRHARIKLRFQVCDELKPAVSEHPLRWCDFRLPTAAKNSPQHRLESRACPRGGAALPERSWPPTQGSRLSSQARADPVFVAAVACSDAKSLSTRSRPEAQMHPSRVRTIAELVNHLIEGYSRALYRQTDLKSRAERFANEIGSETALVTRTRASADLAVEHWAAVTAGNLEGPSQHPPDLVQAPREAY
jgi:hypothetical protein